MLTVRAFVALATCWLTWIAVIVFTEGAAQRTGDVKHATAAALFGFFCVALIWGWEVSRTATTDFLRPALAFPLLFIGWFSLGLLDVIGPIADAPLWDPMPARMYGYAAAGLIAYVIGLQLGGRPAQLLPSVEGLRARLPDWNAERTRLVLAALFAITVLSYVLLIAAMGVPALKEDPNAARLETSDHTKLFFTFYTGVLLYMSVAPVWIWGGHRAVTRLERRLVGVGMILLPILILGLANRGMVLEPAVLVLLIAHYLKRRLRFGKVLILATVGVVFLSIVGMWRDYLRYGPAHFITIAEWGFPLWSLPFTYIYSYVRDSVATFRDLTSVIPQFVPYQHGLIHLFPLRAFLPGRTESSDFFFKRILYNQFVGAGRPASLLGSLYADGGMLAIVVGMLSFGWLSQYVYRRLLAAPTALRLLLYVWITKTALFSCFSNLMPYPSTVLVPVAYAVIATVVARKLPLGITALPELPQRA